MRSKKEQRWRRCGNSVSKVLTPDWQSISSVLFCSVGMMMQKNITRFSKEATEFTWQSLDKVHGTI